MLRKPTRLITLALLGAAHAQTVTHRWNFNSTGPATHGTVISDQISSAPGVIVGNGAVRSGTQLTLPGTTNGNAIPSGNSAYFDLPNGIISSKTNLTLEIWATVHSAKTWQRLFDFGRMNLSGSGEIPHDSAIAPSGSQARDSFMLSVSRDGLLSQQRFSGRIDGGTEYLTDNSFAIAANTQYHFVATYQSGVGTFAATGGRITWYRNGVATGQVDLPFRLAELEDVNNWLGRSQWSNDSNANISYNDVRLYDHVLGSAQISANFAAGPDAAFPAPAVQADALVMGHGRKARIRVLENDSGEIARGTLAISAPPAAGTATVSADGSILYSHTTGTPAGDSFQYTVANTTGQSSTGTVTINFSDDLKIPSPDLNVPAAPPATAYSLVNALGSLTFNQPLCLRTPPGETQRLFVCEKGGNIRVVDDVTSPTPVSAVFFNLASLVNGRSGESIATDGESGLLSMAFHPDYAENRQFYVFYSVNLSGLRYQRVSQFTTQADNPNAADTASEIVMIEQRDQASNHNGGDLHFGPDDGFLYISVGDEGDANDTRLNSQLINKDLFSGILRLDVDRDMTRSVEPTAHDAIKLTGPGGTARFAIPKTNPYVPVALGGDWNGTYNGSNVTGTVRREFWATGLRNPWRMSFDGGTSPATLWCADVGQDSREEVDLITRGANLGWVYREANLTGPRTTNPTMPANFDALYHTPPVYNYNRNNDNFGGTSVTGGVVYRGARIADLYGKYIFADYNSGNIWSMDTGTFAVQRIAGEGNIAAFGTDPSNGDILLADLGDGIVRRLTATTATGSFPATLSATGLFADLTDLSPSPGLVPYTVNLPFWSDHAIKSRWFVIPDGTSSFTASTDGLWTLPAGTIWVKHFDMEMQRGVPASKKRIETRLIVKTGTGAYGVSYRWNEAGTEAYLAADAGEDFVLEITDGGSPAPQTWRIPSRAECLICHTPQAGHALSFNTRQLNLENAILGETGNQLEILHAQSFLTSDPGSANLLPRYLRPDEDVYSIEARVRSYLAVNCSYCHKDGGSVPAASWDGRPELTLAETGLVNGEATQNGGDSANKLVVPGDTTHSIVLNRIAASNGFTRMPPVGSNVIDQASVDLLTTWINGELAARQTYEQWRATNFEPDDDPAGQPGEDPDMDGRSNRDEFLAGTHPLDGSSFFQPKLAGHPATLGFTLPANRSFRIDVSTDLGQWNPWDIPGNQGLPVAGGFIEFDVPAIEPRRFFRVELEEN
ncbi:PQQ-dependent sugar dehydrogenase [Luteolibacter marinus]|uniref:PQQ-dependent sugar dehydrogenase n=1 Tax=Luteolibacter marinus TaxID=2776705 RepID=UPI001866A46D|nr:PQQ-dependent sugar dehydrogenase [Luteolibacter marinus]